MNYFINVLIIAILIITTFYNKCFVNKLRQKTCSAQHVFRLVPKEGLEPTHPCGYRILSPTRLPISPLRHI